MRYITRPCASLIALIISLSCLSIAGQVQANLAPHSAALIAANALQDAAADEDAELGEDPYFESAADHDGLGPRQHLIEPRYPDIVPRSFQPRFPPTRNLHRPAPFAEPAP